MSLLNVLIYSAPADCAGSAPRSYRADRPLFSLRTVREQRAYWLDRLTAADLAEVARGSQPEGAVVVQVGATLFWVQHPLEAVHDNCLLCRQMPALRAAHESGHPLMLESKP